MLQICMAIESTRSAELSRHTPQMDGYIRLVSDEMKPWDSASSIAYVSAAAILHLPAVAAL